MLKTIRDYNLKGKKVIIRCDFNVPIKDGKITDDTRIKESLETLKYASKEGARIILLSHMGRIKTDGDKDKYSLKPVAKYLGKILKKKIRFIDATSGPKVDEGLKKIRMKEIVMLENTRFEDLNDNKESDNNEDLAKYWASFGDIFINDAFATAHRKNASNYGIAKILPSGIGFLVEKELNELSKLNRPSRPYTVVLGGAKIDDKIGVINKLAKKADYVLIGGAMANTFLRATGFNIGASKYSKDNLDYVISLLSKYENKIILPTDCMTEDGKEKYINEIDDDDVCYDIGTNTINIFKNYINKSKTVFLNGPLGYFEKDEYQKGTKEILEAMSNPNIYSVIGGGDTAAAANVLGYKDKIKHISTGGGASLVYLEGHSLPALKVIDEK